MTLTDINKKWNAYKKEYGLDSPIEIEDIRYDAAKGVESSFNITELYSDIYILHLGEKVDLYRSDYIDLILWHEFTHLYDYLTHPYQVKVMRKVYTYMHTYSEYHASRRVMEKVLKSSYGREFDPEKSVIPMAYKDISMRNLVDDTLHKAAFSLHYYKEHPGQQAFHVYFRYVMYLMGYVSHFQNAEDIIGWCLESLELDKELYLTLYHILSEKDFHGILKHMDDIYEEAGLDLHGDN
ncbi:MAG: hypothetical protein IJ137_09510 [Eubacterium sp.]|nr:hypothetical protein [Eubacterium sp.]